MYIIMNYKPPRYVGVVIFILLILLLSTQILFFKQIAQYHYTRKSFDEFFTRSEISGIDFDEFRQKVNKRKFSILRYLSDLFMLIFKYRNSSSGSINNEVYL